jgi:CDGSH-type Zn-finger protein/uncharacterized Fe-S cluster protein YjdI
MCCYLYAAFSLKTDPAAGLTEQQLAAVRQWRGVILDVAIDEMLHLGLVANIMTAIGAQPHFSRPNFPVSAGYHPSGVIVELVRFCPETLDHFIYLERPEGADLKDGAGFRSQAVYQRSTRADNLVPSAQDFLTVGHLYRAIRAGLNALASRLGEANLFIGSPRAQMTPEISGFAALVPVTDLASAEVALDSIIAQGEGTPAHREDSHFARFCAVRDDYRLKCAADPAFEPAWPAARNPVMRKPPLPDGKVHISSVKSAQLLDLVNAAYGLMLRCLMGAFGQAQIGDQDRAQFYGAAIDLMHVVVPLAEILPRLPASDAVALPKAGMTFTLPRSITPVSDPRIARSIIGERAGELSAALALAAAGEPRLAPAAESAARIAGQFQPAPAIAARAAPAAAPSLPAGAETAIGKQIIIHFDGKRCIHSRFCVLQAPSVFKANTPGSWIFPDSMDPERLVAVAENCPSGAITYERRDGRPAESGPPVNVAKIRESGPYAIHADIDLAGAGAITRATLCRCGASRNKPFCDGSHHDAGFTSSGEPATRTSQPLDQRAGRLAITPQRNGPLVVAGPLEICAGSGRTVDRVIAARLCRCGGSGNKPFCDGSHARIGFTTES